ncbi:MAG: (S)-ureidoglycine--glyoxylate transaminase [Chloroflexota bacterium]
MGTPFRPLDVPRRLLMGSGPSNPEPRVLQALAAPTIAPDDPGTATLLRDVQTATRAVLRAPNATAVAVGGASRSGIEAALASLIEPGDHVLVGVYGHFGELLCTLAGLHGADVERFEAPWGNAIDPRTMAARIREVRPKVVAIVHADTSTGIVQPLEDIGQACRETGALLVVDVVLSIGGCKVDGDGWSIDVAIGGLQKCVGGPPGLALVTVSERAQRALAQRGQPTDSPYLDLNRLIDAWRMPDRCAEPHLPIPMLFAAREALGIVLDEGLETRWQRHSQASRALRAGLTAMQLDLFTDPAYRVPLITLVRVPAGVNEAAVRAQLLEQHGIEIMAAFGPLRGMVWRIGAMGTNAARPSVLGVLAGLEAVLAAQGLPVPRGAAVDAALSA